MDDERSALTRHILALDRQFYQLLQSGVGRAWADVDLTMPQLKVLFLAGHCDGVKMTYLARTLGMTLSTLTGIVDRLVSQGLARREEDAHDRRVVLVYPTERGSALLQRLLRIGQEELGCILDRLSLEELRKVAEVLDLLLEGARATAGGVREAQRPHP